MPDAADNTAATEAEPITSEPAAALPPDAAAEAKPDAAPSKSAIQDNTPGIFIKHIYTLDSTANAWASLQKSDLNPVLLQQLQGLKKKLSTPFSSVEILYSDYERAGKSDPANSKILAVKTNAWTYFSKERSSIVYYYDSQGNAPELSMDRAPFAYQYISSPFDLRRRHPITHRIRPHEGVDLKGPYGTSIAATGGGIVTYAGWKNGYGRIIIIDHNNSYQTRYAHLSAIGVKAGQYVKRGQIIGRLGNSGASTGPHLHYEVRIDGIPYNPMTVKLPSYQPLPASELKAWKQYAVLYLDAINDLKKK